MVDHTYLPVVGNCSSFIECMNGKKLEGSCYEDGIVEDICKGDPDCEVFFNYKTQSCEGMSKELKCLPTCKEDTLTSFCYDGTCTKYVLCYYGVPVLRECFYGLQYNALTDRCDFPQYVDCVQNDCPQHSDLSDIVYIPSKSSCSKYYICSDGEPWTQECTKGLLYNPECKCCDYPSNFECKIQTIQQRNIQPYSRTPPRSADITCPDSGVYFYPHKSLKDAYYYCVNGHGLTLDCTPGLLYSAKLQECVLPQYVES